jgi:hypothetical protein
MNAAVEILNFVASIFIFLALVPALWISGRIILRNLITADHRTRLFLWLVLGGFFLIPLADLISYFSSLLMLAVPLDQNTTPVVLFLGTTSWLTYTILFTAIGVITYAVGIYYGRKIIDERRLPMIKDLALNALEENLMVLGLAGLLHSMVTGILLRFFSIRIPSTHDPFSWGFMGALTGLIGAFTILTIVIIYMDAKLKSQQTGRTR